MNLSLTVILFMLLKTAHLEDVQQDEETYPVVISSSEGNGTTVPDAAVESSVKNAGLSPEAISELHDLAKNISHSKGIFRETKNEALSKDDLEVRRSILKKVAVASESDALKEILQSFNSNENKLHLLEQMEFLVHQYDVAVNFATQGGIQIIVPLLFSSDDKIVSSVASVLGAAMQSNPTVQKCAMKHNVCGNLLKLLSHKSPVVLSRIVFALACLLRNAAEAQEEFVSLEGVSKLADVLKNDEIATNTKLKVVNLFSDLAVEQQTARLYPNDRSFESILELERLFALEMQRWDICKLIPSFLDLEDFDSHQKIVSAMASIHNSCHKDFKTENINNRLNKLLKIYDPDFGGEGLYPVIDRDLKKALHSDLKALFKEINEESTNNSTPGLLKTEL